MTELFYQKQINDKDSLYTVTIGGLSKQFSKSGSVTGVLNSPIPLAAGNDFNSLRSAIEAAPVIGRATALLNQASDYAKVLAGKSTTADLYQTKKTWRESQMPVFNLELTFYGLKAGVDRPIDKVKAIYSALFPTANSKNFVLTAPLGYFPKILGDGASGTLSLQAGRWINIRSGLIVKSASFTPSIQVMRDGTPLYFTGNVELEPYRMVTYSEFLNWFTQKQINNTVNQTLGGNTDGSGGSDINLGRV